MSRFLDALHSGRVLLMDGAMGTELQRAGIGEGECYEAWNLMHPDKVLAIHKAYVEAGAEVVLATAHPATRSKNGEEPWRRFGTTDSGCSFLYRCRSAGGRRRFS